MNDCIDSSVQMLFGLQLYLTNWYRSGVTLDSMNNPTDFGEDI